MGEANSKLAEAVGVGEGVVSLGNLISPRPRRTSRAIKPTIITANTPERTVFIYPIAYHYLSRSQDQICWLCCLLEICYLEGEMKKYFSKNYKSLVILTVLLVSLPWTLGLALKAFKYLTGAAYKSAAIVVQADQSQGNLKELWKGVAQGYEKMDGVDLRLEQAVPYLKKAGVKYIRIDHVFDGYEVVSRREGKLFYDWTKLDLIVGDILAAGAAPFFSLSYMPSAISQGDILDLPKDWGEWGQVVAALVGHYSRDYRGGIANVVYEVWNEPDLFGGWKMYGNKSYAQLYTVASNAAAGVRGAKPFKIGGPATTGFYSAWVDGFYKRLDETVRIDFFSWHRYSANVADFVKDVESARKLIAPQITRPQDLYITEWGVNPERSSSYDGIWAAAHFLAVNRALVGSAVDMVMPFEVIDGGHGDKQYHGGWGMFTSPKYGAPIPKPRWKAYELLSRMSGERLALAGEGDFVTALAARDNSQVIRILVVNYDVNGKHQELVPLTVAGLGDTSYNVTEEYLTGRRVKNDILPDGGMIRREITLSPSDAVLITLMAK